MKINHINNLDGLRGFAALMVVIAHSSKADLLPDYVGRGVGQFGVMLFFALSGFLMSYLYLNRPFSKKEIWDYTVSRVARVYPLFAFAVLVHWLIFYFGYSADGVNDQYPVPFIQIDTADIWLHLTFQKGESVFWTISPEFRFYAFFVVIWLVFAKFLRTSLMFYTIIVALFILFAMMKYDANKIHLLFSLDFFLAGMLAGDVFSRYGQALDKKNSGYEFFLFFSLFIMSFPTIYKFLFDTKQLKFQSDVNAILSGLLVFYAALGGKWIDPLLSNRLARFFGKISFSAYLFHLPILTVVSYLAVQVGIPAYIMFIPYLILVALLSTASFYIIENPCRQGLKILFLGSKKNTDEKTDHRSPRPAGGS